MTEAEWLACESPWGLLLFLHDSYKNDRKFRLFSCGCYRQVPVCLEDEATRSVIETAERYADALAGPEELRAASAEGPHLACFWVARPVASATADGALGCLLNEATWSHDLAAGRCSSGHPKALNLLRDVFGNPFRPMTFSPSWRTSSAVTLAAQMYDSRDFGAMPILADALQDAGCDSTDILSHCRQPGEHVRGCWVVDLVLGKE